MLHQKLDYVTTVLQTLSKTVQSFTEVGNQWQQRSTEVCNQGQQRANSPARASSPLVHDHKEAVLTTFPKAMKLEFPRFRGESPSGWVYNAHQFFSVI